MVLVIPFTCEVRVKCISLVGGDDGEAPQTLKVYKNEQNVDINLQEEKKCLQLIDLNQGDLEYPLNLTKFGNVSNIILCFDGNFGASHSSLKFIGLKGDRLRNKIKKFGGVYEVTANLADHKVPQE